jgi:hypothetical protein
MEPKGPYLSQPALLPIVGTVIKSGVKLSNLKLIGLLKFSY